jgi:hypothetical protein
MAVCSFPSVTPRVIICYSHICAWERHTTYSPPAPLRTALRSAR